MDTKKSSDELFTEMVKHVEYLSNGPASEEVKTKLREIAEAAPVGATAFDLLPEDVVKSVLGESFTSTMGDYIPTSLSNGGMFDNELTHEFSKDNACPYFRPDELCALDGRICLWDTETFPVCPKYKEGHSRKIPGVKGDEPEVPPQDAMPRDPITSQRGPFNPFQKI